MYVLIFTQQVPVITDTSLQASLDILVHASTHDLLVAIVETLRRHIDIWACMNAIPTITQALYASHQAWKSRGIQMRYLLSLLMELDDGHRLDVASRQQINVDITHCAQVSVSSSFSQV